jgi:hypothetical protein
MIQVGMSVCAMPKLEYLEHGKPPFLSRKPYIAGYVYKVFDDGTVCLDFGVADIAIHESLIVKIHEVIREISSYGQATRSA